MRVSETISFIMILGAVTLIIGFMVSQFDTNGVYGENVTVQGISFGDGGTSSNVTSKYNFALEINDTFAPVMQDISNIQNPDTGFFSKIALGIVAIPQFILSLVIAIFQSLYYGTTLVNDLMLAMGIPPSVIIIFVIIIIIYYAFKIADIFQRYPT